MMATTTSTARKSRSRVSSDASPPEIDNELYLRLFRTMALHRALEDRMVSMYRQGELLGSL